MLRKIAKKQSTKKEVFVATLLAFLFIFMPFSVSLGEDTVRPKSCPLTIERDYCVGPWAVKLSKKSDELRDVDDEVTKRNKEKLADAINNEIKKYPGSKFLKENGGLDNPGKDIVEAGINAEINPIILVAIAAAKSKMASQGEAALSCGSPWGQAAIKGKPSCDAGGGSWFEYNKTHKYNKQMLDNQAERIYRNYIGNTDWDPPIITLEDFIMRYNEKNEKSPLNNVLSPEGSTLFGYESTFYRLTFESILAEAKGALDCGGSETCGPANFPRDMVSEEEENHMIQNCPVYTSTADKYGIPWQVLAAIHFREGGFNPNGSVISGRDIGTPEPDQGGMVFGSLQESADKAAEVLIGKNGGMVNENPPDDVVKDALFGYNGRARCYGSPDGSPYVMNNFDASHKNMQIIKRDNGPCECCDARAGAFVLYKHLRP